MSGAYPKRVLTDTERAVWGECPHCGAKHGEICRLAYHSIFNPRLEKAPHEVYEVPVGDDGFSRWMNEAIAVIPPESCGSFVEVKSGVWVWRCVCGRDHRQHSTSKCACGRAVYSQSLPCPPIATPTPHICAGCRWFELNTARTDGMGKCRLHGPVVQNDSSHGIWPSMGREDFCGEWAAKE